MASDDARPDADRPLFTTRTYLLPDDETPDGDGADAAFGTGDIDDDALDAIVQDIGPDDAPAFVWPSEMGAPDAVPVADDPLARADGPLAESDDPVVVPASEFFSAGPDVAEPEVLELEALEALPEPVEEDAVREPEVALDEGAEAVPEDAFADAAVTADDPEADADAAHGVGSALASAGTAVLGALADVVEPDAGPDAEADDLESAGRDAEATADIAEPVGLEAVEPDAETDALDDDHVAAPMPTISVEDLYDPAFVLPDEPAAHVSAESEAHGEAASDHSTPDPFGEPAAETAEPAETETDELATDAVAAGADAPADAFAEADAEDEVADAEHDATAAVDLAFDSETDAAKADADPIEGFDGDLEVTPLGPEDFEPGELRAVLRTMMMSRKLDEKMLTLLKQGKGFFHIGSSGHEASQIAVGREFEGGRDWFCFYYRDLATALSVGVTPAEVLRSHFGKATDPFGGGRQMPEHFGHRDLNILSTSSSVGAQYVPAVGFALAVEREDDPADGPTRAVYASGGEGSTSQGAFHEALNWAAREALPVLFHIQDNKFAISVPVVEQTAGGSIWHLLGGYAGLKRLRYDGTDFFASAAASRAALAHIRAGLGPVALHADLVRLLPHSSSDDHRKYREADAIAADLARDPIPALVARLVEADVMTEDEVEALRAEVSTEIDRLAKEIEKEADPDPASASTKNYFEGEDTREYEAPGETGDLVVMVDAINHALDEEMTRDPRVLVYGEDVGGGKGGVFTATRGLTAKHGRDRCFNSPLAEHSVIGSAVGLACAGYKPVVEIQFADYIWPGLQPLRNQVASMRYRSNGDWACPMVLRIPAGGYIHGGLCHSQNIEAIFGHFPGLHVVMPSNAADAKGLLKAAIRGEDPVLFLEHKALYRQGPARRPEPHSEYLVPLGKAAIAREGTDLTIVTWGAIVYKALNVAKTLEKEGVSVEVIDIRSMLPFDTETVLASVRKTHRVLVAYEDHEFMGFGAEISAQIADKAFGALDAPVKRVAGAFSWIPYADVLEKQVLPQDGDVLAAAREVLAY